MRGQSLFIECRERPALVQELLRDPELRQWQPLLKLDRAQLRFSKGPLPGNSRRTFLGVVRWLPSEVICAFEQYRRVAIRYSDMRGLAPLSQVASEAASEANAEWRFNIALADESRRVKFHNGLFSQIYDASKPGYDSCDLYVGFASPEERRRFVALVAPALYAQAPEPTEAAEAAAAARVEEGTMLRFSLPGAGSGGEASGSDGREMPPPPLTGSAAEGGGSVGQDAIRSLIEDEGDEGLAEADKELLEFEVDASKVMEVKARCRAIRWPLLEEYEGGHLDLVARRARLKRTGTFATGTTSETT
jgi:hypothetical protein